MSIPPFLHRYTVRPFEIVIKNPLRWALGCLIVHRDSPKVFYGYERIPGRDEPAAGGIVKLQDLAEVIPHHRWAANRLYLISSCLPWTVRWQVKVAKFFGAKLILNQNGVAYPAWKPEGWEEENERMKWVYQRADNIIFQSEFCRRSAEKYLGACQVPSVTHFNPVDLSVFAVANRRKHNPTTILLAGTHQFAYRVRCAIEVLRLLKNSGSKFQLMVYGRYHWKETEDEAMQEAILWTKELGVEDSVQFNGSYTQRQLPTILENADILLHTKVMDPCPRLVVEAMAAGLPIVYPASGGLPEMIAQEAGIGVPSPENYEEESPASPQDLCNAVLAVDREWGEYSRGARACAAERFGLAPWLETHKRAFQSDVTKKEKTLTSR